MNSENKKDKVKQVKQAARIEHRLPPGKAIDTKKKYRRKGKHKKESEAKWLE